MTDHESWVCLNAAGSEAGVRRSLEVGPHGSVDDAADDATSVNEEAVECDLEPSTEVPVEASTELGKPAAEDRHSLAPGDHAWASAASVADVALAAYAVEAVVASVEEAVGVATKVADSGNSTEVATEHLCSVLLPKWMPKIQGFDGEYFGTN